MTDRTTEPNDPSALACAVDAPAGLSEAPLPDYQDLRVDEIARVAQCAQTMAAGMLIHLEAQTLGQMADIIQAPPPRLVADYMAAPWCDLPSLPAVVIFLPASAGEGEAEHIVLGRVRRGRRWTVVLGETGSITLLRSDLRLQARSSGGRPVPTEEQLSEAALRAQEPDAVVRSMLALATVFEEARAAFGHVFETDCDGLGVDASLKDCAWSVERSDRDDVAHVRVKSPGTTFGQSMHLVGRIRSAVGWTAVRSVGSMYLLRDDRRVGPVVPLEEDERAELLRLRAMTHGGEYGSMIARWVQAEPMPVTIEIGPRVGSDPPAPFTASTSLFWGHGETLDEAIEILRSKLSRRGESAEFIPPSTRRSP